MNLPTLTREELIAKWGDTIHKTFDIFTWTSPGELAWLCEMAAQVDSIVEVGSYHGKSAKCMSLANPKADITCIDLPQDERCWEILSVNLRGSGVQIFRGNTGDWLRSLRPGGFKFAFIDGGHLEVDVTADIQNILPHMAPGAILAGHDWRHNNPLDGINVAVEKAFDKHRIRVFESIWHIQL